jgi:hypothetical protein
MDGNIVYMICVEARHDGSGKVGIMETKMGKKAKFRAGHSVDIM